MNGTILENGTNLEKGTILENQAVERLTRLFRRSPLQSNRQNESDAEIICLPGTDLRLAITADSLVEEIASGLYTDPQQIGWMAAMVNFSDLAAVGAEPAGLLIAETLPPDLSDEFLNEMQQGIEKACRACGSYVLGGDTNSGSVLELAGCAVGTVNGGRPLSRVGCKPGDALYSTGPLGTGNAFAINRFLACAALFPYAPVARIREGQLLRGLATACIDTSDGVLASLDQLMRVNSAGFHLDAGWASALEPGAARAARQASIPSWLLLAGQHGEFELLFTIPPENEEELQLLAGSERWQPVRLGSVTREHVISLDVYGRQTPIDTARVRNAAFAAQGNIQWYIQDLIDLDEALRKGNGHYGTV